MTLTLEVMSPEGKTFIRDVDSRGATIGRDEHSDVCLPDPARQLSRKHALISFRAGVFYIEDVSQAGICVNGTDNRIPKNEPYPLKSQDLLIIEPYEIRVTVAGSPPVSDVIPSEPGNSQGPLEDLFRNPTPLPVSSDFPPGPVDRWHYEPLPVQRVVPPSPEPAPEPVRESRWPVPPPDWDPDANVHVPAPRPAPPSPEPVPPNRSEEVQPPTPSPTPAPTPAAPTAAPTPPRPGTWIDLDDVLRGAGLQPVSVDPDFAKEFGRILRVLVEGLIQLLHARQQIKAEFGIAGTMVMPSGGNNPLKFSADVDDALHNLLVKRSLKYLAPVEAFRDALDDLAVHQEATLAGVRVAFDALLKKFDPDDLQGQFDREAKRNVLLEVQTNARYWELYCKKVRGMVRDLDGTYRDLFEKTFASAYEEEFRARKSRGRDK